MRFPNHVSVAVDLVAYYDFVPVLMSIHPYCGSATTMVPTPAFPHVEPALPIFWPPGYALGKNQLTKSVLHRGFWIAQQGHDLGVAIPHISIPPDNTLTPVLLLTSKRKAMFSAGEVKADKKAIACCTMFDLAMVPTPMIYCSTPSLPVTGTGSATVLSDLIVGMHVVDLVAGWLETAISVFLEAAMSQASLSGGPAPTWAGPTAGGSLSNWAASQFTTASIAEAAVRGSTPGLIGGLARLAGQEWFDYHGDASGRLSVVGGAVGHDLTWSQSGEDHRSTLGSEHRIGPSNLASARGRGEVSFGGTGTNQDVDWAASGTVGIPGTTATVGVSDDRPDDDRSGFYGGGTSPFGSGTAPLGEGWASDAQEI